jgi:hypothetical protein
VWQRRPESDFINPHTLFAPADAVAFEVGAEVDPAERQGIIKPGIAQRQQ